jgi:structural maintenance of chromosomes protein 6
MYVKVKPQHAQYSKIIESLLNRMLNSFAVETHEDRNLLNQLLRRYRHAADIFIGTNRRFDFSQHEPSPDLLTVFRALEIEHETVLQQLVINSKIEKAVLVHNRDKGNRLTANGYPRNATSVHTIDHFSVGSRSGGLSTDPVNRYNGAPRLSEDIQQYVKDKQDRLARVSAELADAQRTVGRTGQELQALRNQRQTIRNSITGLERQVGQLERALQQLQERLEVW